MATVARSAAPFAALALATLAFVADPRVPLAAAAAGSLLFAGAGAARSTQAARKLSRRRASADRQILLGGDVAWRSLELVDLRMRSRLGREVERTLRVASADRLPSASPLNRPLVRRNATLLQALAARLEGDEPVTARGVLLARRLLHDPCSPLYDAEAGPLAPALTHVLGALEP